MKINLSISLIIIDILTVLLFLSILQVSNITVRIVLGLPFMLFFPGFALVAALFPGNKKGLDTIERIALSIIVSLVITALIGLGLNYTPWGIRLEPVMYSISGFILAVSVIALIINKISKEDLKRLPAFRIRLNGCVTRSSNFIISIILLIAVAGSTAAFGYIISKPKTGEQYTDFYILGNTGKAENYPSDFIFNQGRVSRVSYDKGISYVDANLGKLTLVILNEEKQETFYEVELFIEGQATSINVNGENVEKLCNIKIQPAGKWESKIGFAPQRTGEFQKVEFRLYKNNASTPISNLYLWINAVEK